FQRFVVVFKDATSKQDAALVLDTIAEFGGTVLRRFEIINAVSAEFPSSLVNDLIKFPQVDFIEEDKEVHTQSHGDEAAL
ncbi:hypothetical protein BC830DRAFT_1174565, partial [Chytriomyces sp. MP71]